MGVGRWVLDHIVQGAIQVLAQEESVSKTQNELAKNKKSQAMKDGAEEYQKTPWGKQMQLERSRERLDRMCRNVRAMVVQHRTIGKESKCWCFR